jgi:hypothetical protein
MKLRELILEVMSIATITTLTLFSLSLSAMNMVGR